MTFLFENHVTVTNQIHEMMRVERIVREEAINVKLDTYNELFPQEDSLAATMFIEIIDSEKVQEILDTLLGINSCISIEIEGGLVIDGEFDPRQSREDRASAVHYIQFPSQRSSATHCKTFPGRLLFGIG